jgi:hypothetical protein
MSDDGKIEAWHWLRADKRLNYPPHEDVDVGKAFRVEPPLSLCNRGLHASIRAIDALQYAPGPIVCRVSVWGEAIHGDDKLCAENRLVIWMADATNVLHAFACDVAEEALNRERLAGREPDARSWKAIAMKRAWLKGEATAEKLAAAWAAAWAAAGDAAGDAARAAARDAARDAARAAARANQNERLEKTLWALAPDEFR